MTCEDFIKREKAIWGEDYVDDLIERGFYPILTDAGWKFIYVDTHEFLALTNASTSATLT